VNGKPRRNASATVSANSGYWAKRALAEMPIGRIVHRKRRRSVPSVGAGRPFYIDDLVAVVEPMDFDARR
jgi:hypothetical protein